MEMTNGQNNSHLKPNAKDIIRKLKAQRIESIYNVMMEQI
jgi:hypothetical protein